MSSQGGPEQLTQMLTQILTNTQQNLQFIQTSLDEDDNEMVTQVLFNTFKVMVTTYITLVNNLNDLLDTINIGFASMGYMLHHKQIRHDQLKDYIYYSRLTSDGRLLRSNYHPINIRSFMPRNQVPDSFEKLFGDQDYLPNIMNVWDRGNPDSLLLISFQKINIHQAPAVNRVQTAIQGVANALSELIGSSAGEEEYVDELD